MKRNTSIEDYLSPLDDSSTQAYLTNTIQVADVLEWILKQYGKSEVWQTSFSISEEFLRRLYFIRRSGNVSDFHLVLDLKATNKTLKLWPFIVQVIDKAYLADNHSKILLVKSADGRCATVMTSQNLTRGNRYESAIVTTEEGIFSILRGQMADVITNHAVPLNDVFARKLRDD